MLILITIRKKMKHITTQPEAISWAKMVFSNNMKTSELISLNELGFLYSVIAISFEVIATLLDAVPEVKKMQVTKGVNYDPPAANIIEDFSMILAD